MFQHLENFSLLYLSYLVKSKTKDSVRTNFEDLKKELLNTEPNNTIQFKSSGKPRFKMPTSTFNLCKLQLSQNYSPPYFVKENV